MGQFETDRHQTVRRSPVARSDNLSHVEGMTDRPKGLRDANQLAELIVDLATGEAEEAPTPEKAEAQQRGGLKGGRARAETLTPDRRAEIAHAATEARWKKSAPTE